jgi:two-component system phosphate regulon sensor histidine kinase PhoR
VEAKKQFRFQGLIAGAAAGILSAGLFLFQIFEAVEYQLYDMNFSQIQGSETAPEEIVIVAIDQASVVKLGRWPWPRLYHAEIIRQIAQNGAKVIMVDIGFFEPDREMPANDVALIEATQGAGNVIYPVIIEKVTRGGEEFLVRTEPLPSLKEGAAALGHAHIEQGKDGIVRKIYLSEKMGDEAAWGMGLEALRLYLDIPPDGLRRIGPGRLSLGDIEIPVIEAPPSAMASEAQILHNYEMNISFTGDQGTFEYIPAHRLIDGDVPADYFKGKLVLYGGTAAGLWDSHMTPFSQARAPMPGVEVQANVINTILNGRFIQRASLVLICILTIAAALLMGAVHEHFETRVAVPVLVLCLAGSLSAYFHLFNTYGYWLEITPIHAALVLSFVFALMLKMRQVNVALDREVLNLSQATDLGGRSGEERVVEVFNAAESTLKNVLNIPAAALFKVNRSKAQMELTTQYGLTELGGSRKRRIKIGGGLRGLLIGLEPIPVDGLKGHPLAHALGKARNRLYHSLFVPLLAQGETIGALCVFRPKGAPFTQEESELLQAVSSELGTLWYNASLYSRLVQSTSNPLAPFTYKSQQRRIQTLSVLSDSVRGEKNLMTAIMDSIADGVIVTDVLGTIRLLNPKAKEILGLYAEDIIGQNAAEFVRRYSDIAFEDIREKFQQMVEQGKTFSTEVKLALPTTRFYTLLAGPVRSREGLVQGIVAVLSDITELKELDQMKTDLMSMVTHEIRTPLATVRGFAQILLKGGIPTEKTKEFLNIINRQSNRLVNLVNDFLDITRIESGRQAITKAPLDVEKLIQNALQDLQPLANEKNISLTYDPPTAPVPEVLADRNLMEQVLINLLSNAIKYSPKGAQACVSLHRNNGQVIVDVKDTGLGIPPDAVPRLFEKFYRVRSDDRKDIIGTGLGLSLVKQIIEVHEGTIRVESEHGEGSTFTFTLPIAATTSGVGSSETSDSNEKVAQESLPVAH